MATNYEKYAGTPEKLAESYGSKMMNSYRKWLFRNKDKFDMQFEESLLEWLQEECDE